MREPPISVAQIGKLYCTEVYEYEHEPARRGGVLVISGTGLMLSMMDRTRARWCVDFDTAKQHRMNRIESFMRMVARYHPPLIVGGWFTSTRPEPLQRGLDLVRSDGYQRELVTYSGGNLERLDDAQSFELEHFFGQVNRQLARMHGVAEKSPLAGALTCMDTTLRD